MTDYTTKVCTKCKRELPATTEYFHRFKRSNDGLTVWCKDCRRDYQRQYRETHGRTISDKERKRTRERAREWWDDNKDRANAERREMRKKHSEYVRSRDRRWREANRDKVLEHKRNYYERHKEEILERQKEYNRQPHIRQRTKEYRRLYYIINKSDHLLRAKIAKAKRRTKKHNLPNTFTESDWQCALNYFNGCCAVCGRQLNDMFGEFTAAADHWIPISYEGDDNPGTVPENIVPLCHGIDGCNNSKSNKMPEEWLTETYGARKAKRILKRVNVYFEWVSNQ